MREHGRAMRRLRGGGVLRESVATADPEYQEPGAEQGRAHYSAGRS